MLEYARGDSYWDVDHEGDFIKRLIDIWNVNDQHVRVGLVTYHDDVSEVVHIDQYKNDPNGLRDRITQLARRLRPDGTNDLAKALDYVRTHSFTNSRPNVEKIVVPLVHMLPESTRAGINEAANKLKNDCVTIIGFGVKGTRSNYDWTNWWGSHHSSHPEDVVSKDLMSPVVTSPADRHYQEFSDFTRLESSAYDFDDDHCN